MTPILLALSTLAAAQVPTHVVTGRATELVREKHLPALMSLPADDTLFTYAPAARDALVVADARTGRGVHTLPRGTALVCRFTPDGRRLVVVRHASTETPAVADVHDARTGRILHRIPLAHGEPAGSLVLLGGDALVVPHKPDGRKRTFEVGDRLLTSGTESFASVYDLRTGRRGGFLYGVHDAKQLALSADGRTLATADGKRLRTFDTRTFRLTGERPLAAVASLAVNADGTRVAAGMAADDLFVFDAEGRPVAGTIAGSSIRAVRFAGDGLVVTTGYRLDDLPGRVHEWQLLRVPVQNKARSTHVVSARAEPLRAAYDALGPVSLPLLSGDGRSFLSPANGDFVVRVELLPVGDAE